MAKCKWCHKTISKESKEELENHEELCDFNDGGRSDMAYEDIANKYFNN